MAGADLDEGCDAADRTRRGDQPTGEIGSVRIGHLGKRSKRDQSAHGSVECSDLGREGSLPAWGQRIGTGKWRRSGVVWLMMCRSCSGIGRHLGSQPRANTSITIMRPPQRETRARQHTWRVRGDIRLLLRVGGRRSDVEECAGGRDVPGAVGVGKQPVVADAVEALGQHVDEEAAE